MEISIIVPVYNVERTLSRCLRSIRRQSFTDWELIAVDDASPDRSAKILADFARREPRMSVITHEVNRGVSQARFTGMARARGRYLVFVDSDDSLPRRALERLHAAIEAEKADVVTGGMVKTVGRSGIVRTKPRNTSGPENMTGVIEMPELFDRYFITWLGGNMFIPCMCGKIYRRETIERAGLRPEPFAYGEDLMFQMKLHPHLTRIAFIAEPVYHYSTGGITSTSTARMLGENKRQYLVKRRMVEKYGYQKAIPVMKRDLVDTFFYHFRNLVLLDGMSYERLAEMIEEELRDEIWNEKLFAGITPTPVSEAMRRGDTPAIVAMIEQNVRRIAPRHRLVKAVARII